MKNVTEFKGIRRVIVHNPNLKTHGEHGTITGEWNDTTAIIQLDNIDSVYLINYRNLKPESEFTNMKTDNDGGKFFVTLVIYEDGFPTKESVENHASEGDEDAILFHGTKEEIEEEVRTLLDDHAAVVIIRNQQVIIPKLTIDWED